MSFFQISSKKLIKAICIGTGVSVAVILLLCLLIGEVIMLTPYVPTDYFCYITLAAYAAGSFTGGYIAAAIAGERGLIVGLLCSAAVFLLSVIFGFAYDGGSVTILTPLRCAVLLIFGSLGGIKGVNRRERIHIR